MMNTGDIQPDDDEETGIDRISELPELLIVSILSLLDMKFAVKTCILSKKWKYFWTRVHNIVFEFSSLRLEELHPFISFVDRTLMQCTCPKIKTFCFKGFLLLDFETLPEETVFISGVDARNLKLRLDELVDKWIEFVLAKNVQVVKLGFPGMRYDIPVRLYQSSSLETLEIINKGSMYDILVDSETEREDFNLSWKGLKTLYLDSANVDDEFLEKILFGSPMLETIVLREVKSLSKINITSPSVSELKLLDMSAGSDETLLLDIIAPWVKKLEVAGDFYCIRCNVISANSLEKASLNPDYSYCMTTHDEEYMLDVIINKLLKPVCRVYELVIGVEILQALSLYQLRNEPSIVFQCKDLEINSPICVHEVPGIVCLLASSPYLENLIVTLIPYKCRQFTYGDYKYGKYIGKVFSSFDGADYLSKNKTFPCLKSVVIDCRKNSYSGRRRRKCYEFKIVAYIIKHAPILEKLVLLSSESNCDECAAKYVSLLSLEDKVGKKAIQWELKKMGSTYTFSFSR